jgi:hypothetical protein
VKYLPNYLREEQYDSFPQGVCKASKDTEDGVVVEGASMLRHFGQELGLCSVPSCGIRALNRPNASYPRESFGMAKLLGEYGYPGSRKDNPSLCFGSAGLWPAAACVEPASSSPRPELGAKAGETFRRGGGLRRAQARRDARAPRGSFPTDVSGECTRGPCPASFFGESGILRGER